MKLHVPRPSLTDGLSHYQTLLNLELKKSHFFSVADSLYDMMDLIIFNITFTCTAVIAFNLLVVELNESINFEMLVAFADLVVVLLITALYFFHSEWITSDLYEIGDNFYNSPWYILPIRHQRLLVLPIQRAGREFRLKGLGIFECSLVLFLAVN